MAARSSGIPDRNVPENELTTHYLQVIQQNFHQSPYTDASFRERAVRGYPAMLQALKGLRSDNFDVECANTLKDAKKLVRTKKFDIAIVDLGWFLDPAVAPLERESAGWEIINDILTADGTSGHQTECILYSSRLVEDPRIVCTAAQRGLLPVLKYFEGNKSPVDVAVDSLRAAASHLAAIIEQGSPRNVIERRKREIELYSSAVANAALRNLQRWSAIIAAAFVVSLVLIGVGLILALFGNVRIGVVTSVTSTITAVFSKLARPLYKEAQGNVTDLQQKLADEIKNLRPTRPSM